MTENEYIIPAKYTYLPTKQLTYTQASLTTKNNDRQHDTTMEKAPENMKNNINKAKEIAKQPKIDKKIKLLT